MPLVRAEMRDSPSRDAASDLVVNVFMTADYCREPAQHHRVIAAARPVVIARRT
jgi:hypothetical protein